MHLRRGNGYNSRMRLRIAQSTAVFTRPGSSDYHMFRYLKDSLRVQRFGCDEEVIHTINDWFELQDKQFFVDGVNSLAHRWEKRVVLEGESIEKL